MSFSFIHLGYTTKQIGVWVKAAIEEAKKERDDIPSLNQEGIDWDALSCTWIGLTDCCSISSTS